MAHGRKEPRAYTLARLSYNTRKENDGPWRREPRGMFVVRVIWPIKPRGESATPASHAEERRSGRVVIGQRDED